MVEQIVSGLCATLIAIILHELAHGVVARALGDPTAQWWGGGPRGAPRPPRAPAG
jgi:hypothetical protein